MESTCFTGTGGENASKVDFFVVNRIGQHLLVETRVHVDQGADRGQAVVKYTPLRTHKVVTFTFRVDGQIWTEKSTGRAYGPHRPYVLKAGAVGTAELSNLSESINRARHGGMASQGSRQTEMDSIWVKSCAMAAAELAEATGEDLGEIGQQYVYERKDLLEESK